MILIYGFLFKEMRLHLKARGSLSSNPLGVKWIHRGEKKCGRVCDDTHRQSWEVWGALLPALLSAETVSTLSLHQAGRCFVETQASCSDSPLLPWEGRGAGWGTQTLTMQAPSHRGTLSLESHRRVWGLFLFSHPHHRGSIRSCLTCICFQKEYVS